MEKSKDWDPSRKQDLKCTRNGIKICYSNFKNSENIIKQKIGKTFSKSQKFAKSYKKKKSKFLPFSKSDHKKIKLAK